MPTGYSKPLFKVNEYDRDGDKTESGVYLCFGTTNVWVAGTVADFDAFVEWVGSMRSEIAENYANDLAA